MKKLFIKLIIVCFSFNTYAQVIPIVGAYENPTVATLCQVNGRFRVLNISQLPSSPFTLALQIYVVTSNVNPIPNYPSNWPPSYPDCYPGYNGNGLNHPIAIDDNCIVNVCNLVPNPPNFNATTKTFDWQISGCTNNIDAIIYSVYLDCSLYSLLTSPTNSLYLIQKWYLKDVNGNMFPFTSQPNPVPISFPNFNAPSLIHVPANNNPSEEWLFAYQNVGTSNANIIFNFDIDPCVAYNLNSVNFCTGTTPGVCSTNWTLYNNAIENIINVPQGEYLIIKQEVDISDCAPDCGPLGPPNPVDPILAHFSWRCNRLPVLNFCNKCYQDSYDTQLSFDTELPAFTITRVTPTLEVATHNTECQGESTSWKFTVTNTSQNAIIKEVNISLTNSHPNSLSIISSSSLHIDPDPTLTSCTNCIYPNPPADIPLQYPIEISECSLGVSDPVSEINLVIQDLAPGEFVTFGFDEYHCCHPDLDLMDLPKFFNQWVISAIGIDDCDNPIEPDASVANHAVIANAISLGTGNISGYGSYPSVDLNMELSFSNPNGHTVVPKTIPPQVQPYYGTDPLEYEIDIMGLFGDQNDEQTLGYSADLLTDISGILKVEINVQDAGLLFTNPSHAFFEIKDIYEVTHIWQHFDYYNLACLANEFVGNEPCTTSTNINIACEPRTYCFYFKISDLIALGIDPSTIFYPNMELNGIPSGNRTRFKYTLFACCSSASTTNFVVSFSLLRNETCEIYVAGTQSCSPSYCFIPLASIAGHTTVHCPGCLAPGVIVDNYRMERTSLGYPDVQNNRLKDASTLPIEYTPGLVSDTYSEYGELKLNHSVYGDLLTDYTIAHFEDGYYDITLPNYYPGYTYGMMKANPYNIDLSTLQAYRIIPFSRANQFDIQVLGFDFYIDQPGGTGTCLEGNEFYISSTSIQNPTILKFSIDFTTASAATIADFFKRGLAPNDDKMLFTFTETVLNDILLNPLPTGVSVPVYPSQIDFDVWQIYRLRVNYRVCGNMNDPVYPHPDATTLKKESESTTDIYLTGEPKLIDVFLPDGRPIDPAFVMPSELSDLNAIGISIDPLDLCLLDPTPCENATQNSLGDPFCFICEPGGGFHNLFATDAINYTNAIEFSQTQECHYQLQVDATASLLRKTYLNSFQYFPNEFKPLNLSPTNLEIIAPTGYQFVASGGNVEVTLRSLKPNGGYTFNLTSIPYNGTPPLILNLGGFIYNCLTENSNNPTTGLWIGDEYQSTSIFIPCEPSIVCPTTPTPLLPNESIVTFTQNTSICSNLNTGCALSEIIPNLNLASPVIKPLNPNLSCVIAPANINAESKTISWEFNMANPLIPGLSSYAKNVFIAVPLGGYLSNWQIEYTLKGNYPFGVSSATTTVFPPNGPSPGGYFWLVPNGIFDFFPVNGLIYDGKITATYSCADPAPVDFIWGWNCTKATVPPSQVNFCLEAEWNHTISNSIAVLGIVNNPLIIQTPDFYTACDNNNTTIRACFQNAGSGELQPLTMNLINHGNIEIMTSPAPTISNCNGTTIQYTLNNGAITLTGSSSIPDGDYMLAGDCFCIEFDIKPLCNFGNLQLPSVEIEWVDYCGNTDYTTYDFTPIPPDPQNPSICTDCFSIVKSAYDYTVANGSEFVTFNIEVCGNNNPAVSPWIPVTLWDNYPPLADFEVVGTDPFNGGGSANPYPINNLSSSNPCEIVTVTGIFHTGDPWLCNEAFIDNGTIVLSDTACINILPSCIDVNTDYIANQNDPIGTVDATSLFGCNPCSPIQGKNINVTGTLVLNGNFEFVNCNFTMEPASEIIVQHTTGQILSLSTFRDCHLIECSKMWKGISLEKDAWLAIGGSTPGASLVRGAQYAIKASNNNLIFALRNDFESNYVGIYVPDNGLSQSTYNTSVLFARECNFYGDANAPLPVHYAGQKELLGNPVVKLAPLPLAGIVAVKTHNIFIGHDDNNFAANSFKDMSNGIIGWRSYLGKVFNCKFDNMQPEMLYSSVTTNTNFAVSMNGSAIYANGNGTASSIDQIGFGNDPLTDPFTFKNCRYGIFADRIGLNSHDNVMEDMGTGYRAQLVKNGVSIFENNIDAGMDAVQLLFCDGGSKDNRIFDNQIVFGDNHPTESYAGVNVQENLNQNNLTQVHNNDIEFRSGSTSARYGVITRFTHAVQVTQNTIHGADNSQKYDGVLMEGCKNNVASCNVITGTGNYVNYVDHSAIKYLMGDGPEIACNYMDETPNGIFVIGQVLSTQHNLTLIGNEFYNHNIGLRYGANTMTNTIDFMGNIWFENAPSGCNGTTNCIQARHDAGGVPPNGIDPSTYFNLVNPNNPPNGTYLNATYFPDAEPTGWFQSGGIPNKSCHDPDPDFFCNNTYPPENRIVSEFDYKVANDSIENDPYTNESRWIFRKGLYEKLVANPSLLTDSVMFAFFSEHESEFIGQLKWIEENARTLFLKDSIWHVTLQQFKNDIDTLQTELKQNLNQFIQAIEAGDSSLTSIVTAINLTVFNLNNVVALANNMIQASDSARTIQAESLSTGTTQLNATEIIEHNEKDVNEIGITAIGKDQMLLDAGQLSRLRTIANQCPLAGGNAVFAARALLFMIEGQLYYDDRAICWQEGISIKQSSQPVQRSGSVKVYPNPANSKLTVEYQLPDTFQQAAFYLYSNMGQKLKGFEIKQSKGQKELDISNLVPGFYYYQVVTDNNISGYGKVAVVR